MVQIKHAWQVGGEIQAVVFDCDGTLSCIEGIDELARLNNVFEPVQAMTEHAMERGDMDIALYARRLDLVRPTAYQLESIGQQYVKAVTDDAKAVIAILQQLQKPVYIVSAGLAPPVRALANYLNVPESNTYAVDIFFHEDGQYKDFDRSSPLVTTDGKAHYLLQIKPQYPELALVGDGMNDLAASDHVRRFIGYGGAFVRKNVAIFADFYIKQTSLAAVLPLVLTQEEFKQLTESQQALYTQGEKALIDGEVLYQEE